MLNNGAMQPILSVEHLLYFTFQHF